MTLSHPHIWKWLPFVALGLMLAGDFAPVSDSWEEILSGLAIAVLLVFSGSYYWQERRERRAERAR